MTGGTTFNQGGGGSIKARRGYLKMLFFRDLIDKMHKTILKQYIRCPSYEP